MPTAKTLRLELKVLWCGILTPRKHTVTSFAKRLQKHI